MRISRTSIGNGIRRLSVLLLALWLNGAGCLFCCGRDLPATANAPARDAVAADQLAPPAAAADPHSCCKARVKTRRAARPEAVQVSRQDFAASRFAGREGHAGGGAGVAACCERAGQVSAQARKQRVLFDGATNAKATRSSGSLTPVFLASTSSFRDRSANRRETHLRCCVFLI